MSFGIEFDREKFDLDEEKACEKIDEYLHMWNCFEEEANMVFFYGQIINDEWGSGDLYNEDAFYYYCPTCGKLSELGHEPKNWEEIECSECHQYGYLFNYRSEEEYDMLFSFELGILERFERGYVFRIFEVGLDYSGRERDDYTQLSYYPSVNHVEQAREYWEDGDVSYYAVSQSEQGLVFDEVDKIYDGDVILSNDDVFDCIQYNRIADIVDELMGKYDDDMTLMKLLKRYIPEKAFRTLKKYVFESILDELPYCRHFYGNSSKISEVLGVDYNALMSQYKVEEVASEDIKNARTLKEYGIRLTKENVDIAERLSDNAYLIASPLGLMGKLYKYLRREVRKSGKIIVSDYNDYLGQLEKLEYDLTDALNLFPENLSKTHANLSLILAIKKDKKKKKTFYNSAKKYDVFNAEHDGLVIGAITDIAELKKEGIALHHCVGGYDDRVISGNSVIFAIRKIEEKDVPYVTLELSPKDLRIVQYRGIENNRNVPMSKEVDEFVEWWKEYIKTVGRKARKTA